MTVPTDFYANRLPTPTLASFKSGKVFVNGSSQLQIISRALILIRTTTKQMAISSPMESGSMVSTNTALLQGRFHMTLQQLLFFLIQIQT